MRVLVMVDIKKPDLKRVELFEVSYSFSSNKKNSHYCLLSTLPISHFMPKNGFQDTLYCNFDFILPIVFGPENVVCLLCLLQIFDCTLDNILSLNF